MAKTGMQRHINNYVADNYAQVKPALLYFPILLVGAIVLLLYASNALNSTAYVEIQKDVFFYMNARLSQFPNLQYNLTQMGNALIFMSFLAILILYVPKVWQTLIPASLLSLLLSKFFKLVLHVPRPAVAFDIDHFTIIGEQLRGYASCPSGHAVTVFTTLTVLLFAFMPRTLGMKSLWYFACISLGLLFALSRVGVGAHHPLDVLFGSILGYVCGILGILIDRKFPFLCSWIENKKLYPILMLLLTGCAIAVITKILHYNRVVFYLSLISLIISLYAITKTYTEEFKK